MREGRSVAVFLTTPRAKPGGSCVLKLIRQEKVADPRALNVRNIDKCGQSLVLRTMLVDSEAHMIQPSSTPAPMRKREREFFIDNLLDRIHLIMSQVFLVDRPRAMGV